MGKTNARALPPEECAAFCEQAALILKSGIPLIDAVDALVDGYRATRYEGAMRVLGEHLRQSGSMYEGVCACGVFPAYAAGMVRIGEAAGTLERVMETLATYYEREARVRAAVRNAILYPVVLVAMMAVVVAVLVGRVLPIFEQVFRGLGTEMTAPMTAVMNFGLAAGRGVLWFAAVLVAGAVASLLLMRTRYKQKVRQILLAIFPPARTVAQRATAARLAMVYSMLMGAGFPVDEAARLAPDVVDDPAIRAKVLAMRGEMEAGTPFPKAIADTGAFHPVHIKMIQAGYLAGQTDRVMLRLGELYEQESDDGIRRLVALIEPSLVAVLAMIIGGILLAVMLPLASILSSMG